MDAISFVFGVDSKHLRSQSLKDMIYRSPNDTERGPSSASVTAVYRKTTGEEVKFKRLVKSNLSSEYRINNKVVPFSKYTTVLEKEHLLIKAKNFLVFQGDIESIASQDPKDLTNLIERVCGSYELKEEYDALKQEMERAIDNSGHILNKKRDMAAEIKHYQGQKEEAERFQDTVSKKQELTVQYLLWKLYHIDGRINALEAERDEKFFQQSDAKRDEFSLESKFKRARENKARIHREKTKLELQISKIRRDLEDLLPTSIGYKEKISYLEKKIKQTEQTIERIKRDGQQQEQVVFSVEKDIQLLNHAQEEYNATVPTTIGNGPSLSNEQLQEYEQKKQEVNNRAVEQLLQLDQHQRQYKTEQQRVDDMKSKIEQFRETESQIQNDMRQAEDNRTTMASMAESTTEQLNARRAELVGLENERINIHQREVELNERLQNVLTQLLEARVVQQESEKETRMKESLAMMKQLFPGVHGKLGDLIKPIQRKYNTAVATVLGRNLDAIVVEDQKTAIECIKYMKEQRVGTATFLPLNGLQVPAINDIYRNYVKGARLAIDSIKYDKQYEKSVQYACGNTLICDNLNIAKHICYDMNESVKAVTLDGMVIHTSGLITGGQESTQSTQRWEENEVQELMRTRDQLLLDLNELNKSKRMGSAEESAKNDCSGLQSQLNVYNEELMSLTRKIEGLQGSLQDIRNKLSESEQPFQEASTALEQMSAAIKQLESTIGMTEDEVFADFCSQIGVANIREYEAVQFSLSEEVTDRRTQFASQRSRLEAQLSFEKEQLEALAERLRKLERSLGNDSTTKSQIETELAGMSGKDTTLKTKLEKSEASLKKQSELEEQKQLEINDIRRSLEAKGKDVDAFMKEVTKVETEIEKVRAERISIFRKCKLEGIELPLLRGSMEDILVEDAQSSQIQASQSSVLDGGASMDLDEHPSLLSVQSTDWVVEVNYAQLGEEQKEDGSLAIDREFLDTIKEMNDQISQMAPNLKAVQRLEVVEDRLKSTDIESNEARRAAKRAKEEFNTVKQKRHALFYDAYSHISEQIDRVYKDLTKSPQFTMGGTAYLIADTPDEPYLSGILYHAMPPMKRFRDMELLSGGEKSIAALALLFAIHSYKPAPFFVLDEVDAALDNTNVATVANYIRQQATTQNVQFIVISLKQSVYEKAQSLVGIYRNQELNSSSTMTMMLEELSI
ncbi:hypothetical protein K501DRAFT_243409 [Backusella circina FSU 941]|nr:hypothetical protein K501DRAFT_243409 [Backusella circina FSU 941]